MAKNNSISNASGNITLDPGGSGDSFIQFDINGTNKFRFGVDDTDGDSIKLSQGNALGTNDFFKMTAAGQRTMPLNSAWEANGGNEANATGDGTVHSYGTITVFNELLDQNGDFFPGDGAGSPAVFTAPVTGKYAFRIDPRYRVTATQGGDDNTTHLVTSNRTYLIHTLPTRKVVVGFAAVNNDIICTTFFHLVDMDAGDTATFTIQSSGGSKNATVGGRFGGYLVC